jgi:hypothetical protein
MGKNDVEKVFAAAASRAGAAEEAAALTARLRKTSHIPGLIKVLAKSDVPGTLVAPARAALQGTTPRGLDDFQIVYGLAGVLAKEGTKASVQVLDAFVERAQKAARGNHVIDPFEILGRMVGALGRGPGTAALAKKLAGRVEARREASAALDLMKRLAPAVAAKKGWRISVWIGLGVPDPWFGRLQKGPRVLLRLDPDDKPDWKVDLYGEPRGLSGHEGGMYSNWGGRITQDDFGLPKLQTLDELPAWLQATGKKLRVRFSIAEARIDAGRQRSAIPAVRDWLGA